MRVPVDECPAGPEMDIAVAMALGWQRTDERPAVYSDWSNYPDVWFKTPDGGIENVTNVPRFSTDIATAWDLALAQRFSVLPIENGFFVGHYDLEQEFLDLTTGVIDGHFSSYTSKFAIAETAPLAICRAFLKANGVTEIEMPDEKTL